MPTVPTIDFDDPEQVKEYVQDMNFGEVIVDINKPAEAFDTPAGWIAAGRAFETSFRDVYIRVNGEPTQSGLLPCVKVPDWLIVYINPEERVRPVIDARLRIFCHEG